MTNADCEYPLEYGSVRFILYERFVPMKYSLLALDMDGTLLNSRHQISNRTLEAINKAQDAGKEIVLSTGRCIPELREYFSILPRLRYMICVNGAMIYDLKKQSIIYSNPISANGVSKLLSKAHNDNIMVHFLSADSVVEKDKVIRMDHYAMGKYQDMFLNVTTKVDNIFKYFEDNPHPIEKVNYYITTPQVRDDVEKSIDSNAFSITHADGNSIEFTANGISKGAGLEILCKHLNIPIAETIAAGDSDNDVSMLKKAGLPVALLNSNKNVHTVSKVCVSDCDHDGCAEIIENFLLG